MITIEIIDLSQTIEHNMPVYPGDPPVQLEEVHQLESHGWRLSEIKMGTHTGTHVDAFAHMVSDGKTIDEIPFKRFIGKAQVVKKDRAYPRGIGLFFIEEIDEAYVEKIVAANPLFVGGNINDVLERALLEKNILTFTDLIHLEKIGFDKMFTFIGLPLKIKQGDGSPIRAIALLNK